MTRTTSDGKVANVLQAESILARGARERPDDWRIPFALGFIQSYYLGHFGDAARNLALAAQAPGSPAYVGLLSTRAAADARSEEHTSELQSHLNLLCRLLL